MGEVQRILNLIVQSYDGNPYHGPSLFGALEGVSAEQAFQRAAWSAHCIGELVHHLAAEWRYACAVLAGTAGPWVAGVTTWPPECDPSPDGWRAALRELAEAHQALLAAVGDLDDRLLEQNPPQVRGPYYAMLHGTLHHTIFHTGQISLLAGTRTIGQETGRLGQPASLALVTDRTMIVANLAAFRRDAALRPELARALVREAGDWVYNAWTDAFAPVQFAGYQDMSLERAEQAGKGQLNGTPYEGAAACEAVEAVLGHFTADPMLAARLLAWTERLLGAQALASADQTGWRFVRV